MSLGTGSENLWASLHKTNMAADETCVPYYQQHLWHRPREQLWAPETGSGLSCFVHSCQVGWRVLHYCRNQTRVSGLSFQEQHILHRACLRVLRSRLVYCIKKPNAHYIILHCTVPYHAMQNYVILILCYGMLCYTMLCYAIICYAMLCYVILFYTTLFYTILYYTMLCYAILCCTVLCCAVLYCTVLYRTVLYYIILCHTML